MANSATSARVTRQFVFSRSSPVSIYEGSRYQVPGTQFGKILEWAFLGPRDVPVVGQNRVRWSGRVYLDLKIEDKHPKGVAWRKCVKVGKLSNNTKCFACKYICHSINSVRHALTISKKIYKNPRTRTAQATEYGDFNFPTSHTGARQGTLPGRSALASRLNRRYFRLNLERLALDRSEKPSTSSHCLLGAGTQMASCGSHHSTHCPGARHLPHA
jgi:hypothetical protein